MPQLHRIHEPGAGPAAQAEHSASRPAAHPARRRVLIVASTLHIGGAERVIACLARNLDPARFDVTTCYLKENGVVGEEIVAHGSKLVPIPGIVPHGQIDRFTFLKLRRLIRHGDYQLIHTHDVHGFMDGALCRLITPGVKHIHTFHYGNYPVRESPHRHIERAFWRVPDRLVAVGHRQAEALQKLYSIPAARMDVIWNGVNVPQSRLAPEVLALTQEATVPVIASISTLIEQKGLPHLLEAARLLKNSGAQFKLIIVGHGHLREPLEQLSRTLGVDDRVHFLGWVNQASERALPACDIFVQSSLWEAMSVVVLEAMASGKPAVVTRVGDNEYMIEDGKSGLLVPKADSKALADALAALLADPARRQALSEGARARYNELFTTRHMIQAHEALYERLLA